MSDDGSGGGPAFIPATLLRSDLSPRAKLLGGRVWNLTKKYGYCDASNGYLARDLGVSPRTIERWMQELRGSPHFQFEYDHHAGGVSRKIYPDAQPFGDDVDNDVEK